MTLLVDVGNTRIKVGHINKSHTIALTHADLTQLLPWLQSLSLRPKTALGVCVSSKALREKIEQLLLTISCPILWLDGTTPNALLHNHYENPQRLGADRWLALIGVINQQPHENRPIIHASFGTATTIDTIMPPNSPDKKAQFIGGLILPGPKLMYDSLTLNTAQLSNEIGKTQAFPTNPQSAISSGIGAAQAGAVLRQWHLTWKKHLGTPLLVCSGGGWDLVREETTQAYTQHLNMLGLSAERPFIQPTPVLDGLRYVATLIH